jgi:hypothetical protein
MTGYTYDISAYVGNNWQKATHAKVKNLISKLEGVGHKLHFDNFLSSPNLFDDLHIRVITVVELKHRIIKECQEL